MAIGTHKKSKNTPVGLHVNAKGHKRQTSDLEYTAQDKTAAKKIVLLVILVRRLLYDNEIALLSAWQASSHSLDHCMRFQKSKHLLRSEVSWYDQTKSPLSVHIYIYLHRSTCLASRISIQKEPFPRSKFTPKHVGRWSIDRQLQILHEDLEIVWSWW